ncbi:ERVV2 protein, partial [Psophia crepitans]|nr:ERVV2 protein [Psophia crepitans]
TKFHYFVRCFIPQLGVSELEKAIINISARLVVVENETMDVFSALQEEISQVAKIATQNRTALGMLLASQGGACMVVNTSCCVYVDQSGRIATGLK